MVKSLLLFLEISHIPFVESEIKKLNIELSYGVGHSKMKEKDIEDVFISLLKGKFSALYLLILLNQV